MNRPPGRALGSREVAVLGLLVLGLLSILASLLWANIRWSGMAGGGGSFYALWVAGREFLLRGQNPYDADVARAVQELVYARPSPTGSNPYWFDLPFFLMPFFLPLGAIPSPQFARGIWGLLGLLALVGSAVLTFKVLEWPATRRTVILLGLFSAFNVYAVFALTEGTPTTLLSLSYLAILWAIFADQDELAGALAALSLFKWEVGLPFLLLIGWTVMHQRRWRVIAGMAMALLVLGSVSFVLRPGWLLEFWTAAIAMARSPHGATSADVLSRLSPDHGAQIAWGLTAAIATMLLAEWFIGRAADSRRLVWVALLTLAATPLLGMRTHFADFVPMLPSYVLITAASLRRHRAAQLLSGSFTVMAFGLPWFLLLRGFPLLDRRLQDYLFLVLPVLSILGMYWTRWWFLRPARTWLDEIRTAGQ